MIDTAHRVHFLGRIDAQLKVRGHRVEAQAVEDILQTQFNEIEAAVLDYQQEALVAFVAAPRVRDNAISDVIAAPAEWADGVTAHPGKAAARTVRSEQDLPCKRIHNETGLWKDRPEEPAGPIAIFWQHRRG